MLTYKSFNENNNSGKYSFEIFLDVLDNYKLLFSNYNYLNTEDYSVFFQTEKIDSNVLDEFKLKKSFSIPNDIKTKIQFFIGILNNELSYGFVVENNKQSLGKFIITQVFFKQIFKNKCLNKIQDKFVNIKLQNLTILNLIKEDLKTWWKETPSEIKITDIKRIK